MTTTWIEEKGKKAKGAALKSGLKMEAAQVIKHKVLLLRKVIITHNS